MSVLNAAEMSQSTNAILPGATIGMVGGGQLGRMFAVAAASMGYRVVVFCEGEHTPAAQVSDRVVVGALDDPQAIDRFARQCDVITLEFENIPADTIARCDAFAPTYPAASVLATAQHRPSEKSTLREAGLPVTPFAEVHDATSLAVVAESLGWPLIVKTARSGYDGKGQHRIENLASAAEIDWNEADGWIAEQCIPFDLEVSVVVARTRDGISQCFPVFENQHVNHILDVTLAPARVSDQIAQQARRIATQAADSLDVVGLLCVEFFVCDGNLLINEVAPRPHNSGHLTIEACQTSQFAQHVRAVCNLPLGCTEMRSPAAVMANLLGNLWGSDGQRPHWDKAVSDPGVGLHLYGKAVAKIGRKMGHLTLTGDDLESLKERVLQARAACKVS